VNERFSHLGGNGGTWRDRAADVIPGGSSTGSKRPDVLFGSRGNDVDLPTHYERAEGCTVIAADGRRFLDCGMALGAVAIGYADAAVTRAVQAAAAAGNVSLLPHRLEVEVAEQLVELIPCAEMVRFLRTGAEATAAAIRMARTATGRRHVIACGYFGWLDWCSAGDGVPHTMQDDISWVPFDDVASLDAAVAARGHELAAIIVEPLIHQIASVAWLRAARTACDRIGAVLVFDEIKTAFRVRTGGVQDPGTTSDYMSYCFPQWMSLYQHQRLLQHPRLAPDWLRERSIFDDYPRRRPFDLEHLWWPDPPWLQERMEYRMSPVISMIGRVLDSGEVEMTSVARLDLSPQREGPATNWHALLLDEHGRTLARAPLFRLVTHGGRCGCGGGHRDVDLDAPPFAFRAHLPNVARGASLHIIGPKEQKWVREAPRREIRFASEDARVDGERLHLRWEAEAGEGEQPQVWAQWSRGRDQHWNALAVDLRDGRAELPLDGLPPGQVLVRLLAHDGFDTVASDVMALELPQRAPVMAIIHPREGQTLRSNHPFQVAGNATETDGQPLAGESIRWLLDGHQVGRGRELWLTGPPRGRHELLAQVQWQGGIAEATVRFMTEDPERPEDARYATDVR